jgi:hypothetical protein
MALQRTRALAFARVRSLPSVARRSPLNARSLGRLSLALVAVLVASACGGLACRRGQVHSYTIAAGTEPGWVTIEFENASCSAVPTGLLTRSIAIPASRYLCVSNPIDHGISARVYYQAAPGDRKRRLKLDKDIFREGTFAFGMGEGPCRMVGEQFFFGPKEALLREEDIARLYPLHHPGCDIKGTGSVSF